MVDQEHSNFNYQQGYQGRQQSLQGRSGINSSSRGRNWSQGQNDLERRSREGREYLSDNDEIYNRNQYGSSDDGFRYEREPFGEEPSYGQNPSYGREQGLNRQQPAKPGSSYRYGGRMQNEGNRNFGSRENQYSADAANYQRYDYQQERNSYRPYSEQGTSYPSYGQSYSQGLDQNYGQGHEEYRSIFGSSQGQSGQNQRFYGRGPKGYQRSDERIKEEANEALTDHPGIDASEIDVKVEQGEITLTGTVDSRRAKRLAEDAVENVRGVKDVHNQLRVYYERADLDSSRQLGQHKEKNESLSAGTTSSGGTQSSIGQKKTDAKGEQKLHA